MPFLDIYFRRNFGLKSGKEASEIIILWYKKIDLE